MIFVTVGTQLPFPRLIAAMDEWAAQSDEEVVAQVGPDTEPRNHVTVKTSLTPDQFSDHFQTARVVVAHAGIGTILSAKRFGKPLVILPRRFQLGEHRNDHQMATARQVESLEGVHVAWEDADLGALLAKQDLVPASEAQSATHQALISHLKAVIES